MTELLEHFERATLVLVSGGALKERLAAAYCRHLCGFSRAAIPGEILEDYFLLFNTLHKEPAGKDEDAVRASIRKLSLDEAALCSELIVRMYSQVARQKLRLQSREMTREPVRESARESGGRATAPSLFLASAGVSQA
jgi:hypothetical protein